METTMRGCACCVLSNWRGMYGSNGVLLSSLVMVATLGYALAETTISTSTHVSLPTSQDTSNVRTTTDNLPSTLQSVPYTESSIGPTYTTSSSASTLSSPSSSTSSTSSSSSSTVPSDASSTSTDSTYTFLETLKLNLSNNFHSTSQTSSGYSSNTSTNSTPSRNQTASSLGTASTLSQTTTVISKQTNKSGEVTSTDESSSTDFSDRFNALRTTEKVPAALEMADEQVAGEFDTRTADVTTSNSSSSELPKIHFTLFTDWWHATILLGVEVFFYIITLGIIYFMRRNNIRWPQVLQDDSDSQSDTEPFG